MNTFLVILFLALNLHHTTSDSVLVESEIKDVTVFRQQAQIQRQVEVQLQKGKNIVIFKKLSPTLNPNSIQLKANGPFTILSLTKKDNYFSKPQNNNFIKKLEQTRDSLQREITFLNSDVDIIDQELQLLKNTSNIINNNKVSAVELSKLLNLYRERASELERDKINLQEKASEKQTEINKINAQIREQSGGHQKRFAEITAEINIKEAQNLTFTLEYLVHSAGWDPTYDIRSKNISTPLSINYKAEVYQNTGIDWNDVNFTINSGNPSANATLPEINPSFINFIQTSYRNSGNSYATLTQTNSSGTIEGRVLSSDGEPLVQASIALVGLNRATSTDINGLFKISDLTNGNYMIRIAYVGFNSLHQTVNISNSGVRLSAFLGEAVMGMEEVVVTSYASLDQKPSIKRKTDLSTPVSVQETESQISFSYKIEIPYSIPTDGKPHTVEIKRTDVNTEYTYSTVPKFSPHAYLIGKMIEWDDLNLISGEANIYFENSFIGTTQINPNSFDDTLSVSLGKDPSIVLERKKLRDFEERNFFGNKIREKHAWEINIRNTKSESLIIEVKDQIPISQNEEIEIDPGRLSGGKLDKQTGIITWYVTLPPNKSKSLRFDFQIEYPSNKKIRY